MPSVLFQNEVGKNQLPEEACTTDQPKWNPCSLVRVALHHEAMPIPLEADCMKFQPFLGWKLASTTYYSKILTGANFPICKGLRTKKQGRFNKSSIIQRIQHNLVQSRLDFHIIHRIQFAKRNHTLSKKVFLVK